jgi:hypothetical protein
MCRVTAQEQGITETRTPQAGAEGVGFLFQSCPHSVAVAP